MNFYFIVVTIALAIGAHCVAGQETTTIAPIAADSMIQPPPSGVAITITDSVAGAVHAKRQDGSEYDAGHDSGPVASAYNEPAEAQVSTSCNEISGKPLRAVCTFTTPRASPVMGTLNLTQNNAGGEVRITGTISGLMPPGQHGFHVHETGDFSAGCPSSLEHYNPLLVVHGGPQDRIRHFGDLGNIVSDASGVSQVNIVDKIISLFDKYSVIGRAIVVHAMADDMGRGMANETKLNGNVGMAVGCCVIGYAAALPPPPLI